ncbi:MAG: hypothetical protein ACJ786_18100, partial [Catenulispora sp.]
DTVIAAHLSGAAIVGGTVRPPRSSGASFASYVLDDAGSLPSGPSPTTATPPRRCSFAAAPVELLGGFGDADERVLTHVLASWGFAAARVDGLTFEAVRAHTDSSVVSFMAGRFRLGRSLQRALDADPPLPWQRSPGAGMARYIADRVVALTIAAVRNSELRPRLLRSAPLVACGLGVTAAGSVVERIRR